MKTNSYTRIFILTFLFFSFSAIAQVAPASYVTGGTTAFLSRWAAAHALQSSKIESVCDARARETKSTFATLCTRKYAGGQAD